MHLGFVCLSAVSWPRAPCRSASSHLSRPSRRRARRRTSSSSTRRSRRTATSPSSTSCPSRPCRRRRVRARHPGAHPGRGERGQHDLLPALRRLPRRAAQRRHRQAAEHRHHPRARLRLPQGLHHLRLAGRHAQLGHLGRAVRAADRPHEPLPAQRAGGTPRMGHEGDARELEGAGPGGPAAQGEAEPARPRQPVLGDVARHRRGRPDRRRDLRDRQDLPHRLRRPHLTHVGLGPLPLRDRPRRR